jgi:Spy/CpxP family protein refolding chaperone
MLDLTDEQRQQARDIRLQMREDVKALRDAARDEIHGLLTEEQLAELEELRADRPRFGGRHRGGHGPGPHRFVGPPADRQRPIDTLDLTEEQQIAIDAIRAKLHEDVQALHDAAREAFRAILTPEQIDILDQLHNPAEENVAQPAPATDG